MKIIELKSQATSENIFAVNQFLARNSR